MDDSQTFKIQYDARELPNKTVVCIGQSVQSLSCVQLFATPWTTAHQASLSITNSQSLLKLMSIKSVRPSNHLTHCRTLLLLPSFFPRIRVFSNESVLCIRWPKYWSFSFTEKLSCGLAKTRELFFIGSRGARQVPAASRQQHRQGQSGPPCPSRFGGHQDQAQ